MEQKICVISFDHWNYDKHIVEKLKSNNIDAFHIKIGGFKHKNLLSRISNSFSKIFLGKNPKIQKRQEHIINMLTKNGIQDQILVINPEVISLETHLKIKQFTKKYICYLYDSVNRNPINNLLDGVFDEIYSFDKNDVKQYGFKETTNYNYLEKQANNGQKIKNQVLYIASFDKRLEKVIVLQKALDKIKISSRFIIVGKKTSLFKLKNIFNAKINKLELRRKRINQNDLQILYAETNVVLDIVREHQTGLSFRVFEAMAFEKKLITNNKNIVNYDFYNPNNIMLIDDLNFEPNKSFFETKYQPLPDHVYLKYTLDTWTKNIFNLSN